MSNFNSQEQTIYRSLAGQIQLGFYDDGERFPTVQEIAVHYEVSCCPAQRALKMLEKEGLIQVSRGKATAILRKPYENYLKSPVFLQRIPAFIDLLRSLKLISSSVCFQGLCSLAETLPVGQPNVQSLRLYPGKRLYRLFNLSLEALENRTVRSLYYDIGSFVESAFVDILYAMYNTEDAEALLNHLSDTFVNSLWACQAQRYSEGYELIKKSEELFFTNLDHYISKRPFPSSTLPTQSFSWEPYKGRTRYCDTVAIDLLRKINQGKYPVGTYLPNKASLAALYHVSEITIRRTIDLLNELGVVCTRNGVGTFIVCKGDASVPYSIKGLMTEENFKKFLEALQLLAITCTPVMQNTLPYCSSATLDEITSAVNADGQQTAAPLLIGSCLQAVVHHCPYAAIREIYGKLTLTLLNGSILYFNNCTKIELPDWPAIQQHLSQSLASGDNNNFAETFQKMTASYFVLAKKELLKQDISNINKVRPPRS